MPSFYPRHPRGWRLMGSPSGSRSMPVSIHATLAGGDGAVRLVAFSLTCFYPRHPRGWRQGRFGILVHLVNVSIHATLAGGDIDQHQRPAADHLFLSTPPSRVATSGISSGWVCNSMFLSTPPSRVATHTDVPAFELRQVSIHATLAGGDGSPAFSCSFAFKFLSTPPSRVATPKVGRCCLCAASFYPRHPRGWRRPESQRRRWLEGVSIHATLAGGDG